LSVCPPGSVVCDVTALALARPRLMAELAAEASGPVHVLVPPGSTRRPSRPGLIVHRERLMPAVWHSAPDAISGAALAHCWAQAAARRLGALPHPFPPRADLASRGLFLEGSRQAFLQCVQLGDALVDRQHPLINYGHFSAHISGLTNMRGIRAVREAFRHVRPRTDSPNETWLRLVVVDAGFPEPKVNHVVRLNQRDRFLDLGWPERKVALEYHGAQHFTDPDQARDDVWRRGQLQAAGWIVVEAVYGDLLQPGALIGRLTAAFSGRPGNSGPGRRQF
jgi:hypothetical protein